MKKNSKNSKENARRIALQARSRRTRLTVGIDLGDEWSQCCFLDDKGEIVGECRVKTTREAVKARFGELKQALIAIDVRAQSRWVSELLSELGHEVIVANARELRAITGSDRKSDRVDAEKLARYARVDPKILRPLRHRGEQAQVDLLVEQETIWAAANVLGAWIGEYSSPAPTPGPPPSAQRRLHRSGRVP